MTLPVFFSGGKAEAIGGSKGCVTTSDSLTDWTAPIFLGSLGGQVTGLATDGTWVMAVVNAGGSTAGGADVWATNNGIDWTLANPSSRVNSDEFWGCCIATDGVGTWIMGGGQEGAGPSVGVSHDYGLSWTDIRVSPDDDGFIALSLCYDGVGTWILGGRNGGSDEVLPFIFYSTDGGDSWTAATTDWDVASDGLFAASVCYMGGTSFLAGGGQFFGESETVCRTLLMTTNGGVDWTTVDNLFDGPTYNVETFFTPMISNIVFGDDGTFVALGQGGVGAGPSVDAASSSDGTTWIVISGQPIGGGNSNNPLESTPGFIWTGGHNLTSPVPSTQTAVDTPAVFAGAGGQPSVSTNGLSWTNLSAANCQTFAFCNTAIALGSGVCEFVAGGAEVGATQVNSPLDFGTVGGSISNPAVVAYNASPTLDSPTTVWVAAPMEDSFIIGAGGLAVMCFEDTGDGLEFGGGYAHFSGTEAISLSRLQDNTTVEGFPATGVVCTFTDGGDVEVALILSLQGRPNVFPGIDSPIALASTDYGVPGQDVKAVGLRPGVFVVCGNHFTMELWTYDLTSLTGNLTLVSTTTLLDEPIMDPFNVQRVDDNHVVYSRYTDDLAESITVGLVPIADDLTVGVATETTLVGISTLTGGVNYVTPTEYDTWQVASDGGFLLTRYVLDIASGIAYFLEFVHFPRNCRNEGAVGAQVTSPVAVTEDKFYLFDDLDNVWVADSAIPSFVYLGDIGSDRVMDPPLTYPGAAFWASTFTEEEVGNLAEVIGLLTPSVQPLSCCSGGGWGIGRVSFIAS